MSKPLDAANQTKQWLAGMQTKGSTNYRTGVQNYQGNPMALAAAHAGKWANSIQNAISNGSYVKGLNSADPNTWKQNALNFGADRLVTGAQKKQAKYQSKVSAYHAFLGPILSQIQSMPSDTKSQRAARQQAYSTAVNQYKPGN
jgi:hypothetical protein